jgi:hypothetical protein
MKKSKVVLEIYSGAHTGFYGLTISRMTGDDGEGYRIFGPKMAGSDDVLKSVSIDEAEIDRLIEELKKSKKFLKPTPGKADE